MTPPTPFCCALTVQHTGTHFLAATLARLFPGYGHAGWPGPYRAERVGWRIQHLYGRPDATLDAFWRQWIEGTDLPVVVTLRDPRASMATFWRRTGPQGVNGYGPAEHIDSFRRLARILAGEEPGLDLWRVVPFRTDVRPEARLQELHALTGMIAERLQARAVPDPPDLPLDDAPQWDAVVAWAEAWPVVNAGARRVVQGPAPTEPPPDVPDDVVDALGYAVAATA